MVTTRTNLAPYALGSDAFTEKLGLVIIERVQWERANERKSRIDHFKMEGTLVLINCALYMYYQEKEMLMLQHTFFSKAKCIIFRYKQTDFSDWYLIRSNVLKSV